MKYLLLISTTTQRMQQAGTNYMKNVGRLLQTDATNLQAAWTTGGYGDAFINHNGEFTTAKTCVQQIIEGCIDIAGEVGSQKIATR